MLQMKEQDTISEKDLKLDKVFKVMDIKTLTGLESRMDELRTSTIDSKKYKKEPSRGEL